MAECKRCALKGVKRERETEEKRKRKRRKKMGIKIRAHVFSYAQWSFFKYVRQTVPRLSRLYPLLFAIKILMVSQFGDL